MSRYSDTCMGHSSSCFQEVGEGQYSCNCGLETSTSSQKESPLEIKLTTGEEIKLTTGEKIFVGFILASCASGLGVVVYELARGYFGN